MIPKAPFRSGRSLLTLLCAEAPVALTMSVDDFEALAAAQSDPGLTRFGWSARTLS
jgi:hypothetical protein